MTDNIEIRKALLQKRKQLSPEYIKDKSLLMREDILSDSHYINSKYIYLYSPINNEIDTNYLMVKALKDEKIVSLPVVLSSGDMIFSRINSETKFRKDKFNILEPVLEPKLITDKPGLMIVPLVGFNKNIRLGYGHQYYNNYLRDRKDMIYTIGVAYSFQENIEIQSSEEDIPLDEIRIY